MPRNGSGSYSLPQPAFVPGTVISSSSVNSDFSDIASALTASVAADGQTPITGAFKFTSGSAALPAVTFILDATTGLYLTGVGAGALTAGGVQALAFSAAGVTVPGDFTVMGTTNITLANASVTYAKIQNVGASKLLGNPTASPATVSEITLGSGLLFSGTALTAPAFPATANFTNLSIKVATNTTVAYSASYVVVSDGSSTQTLPFSGTIDLGTTGANALDTGTIAVDKSYAVWFIAKTDGTAAALASLSFTSPTMPTGYTFKARMGAVSTIHASATLYGTWQLGRWAQYVVGLAQTAVTPNIVNGVSGGGSSYSNTSPTLVGVTVTGNGKFVPVTASRIHVVATNVWKNQTISKVLVAPSISYGGANNGPNGSNGMQYPIALTGSTDAFAQAIILLESANIAWVSDATGGAVGCLGWEDNI